MSQSERTPPPHGHEANGQHANGLAHHARNGQPGAHDHPTHPTNAQPVRRGALGGPWRVAAVVPGYNRREDLEKLFLDVSRLNLRGIELWCVLVDNNSSQPLSTIRVPENVQIEHFRLSENVGGAGGFNAGMARVLSGEGLSARFDKPDFIWLLDSDVRVARNSLHHLVKALVRHKNYCAVGSSLVDIVSGVTYEIGGRMNGHNGFFAPAAWGDPDKRHVVPCDYLAACSALVRREAIEKSGLMPEIFIHGDDVEFFLQMTRKTGMKVGGVPRSRAGHPLWSRKFQTWVRYFHARNAFACIDVMNFGEKTRWRRAVHEVMRALGQTFTGMDELAELHLQGLEDAAAARTVGHHIKGGMLPVIQSTKLTPYDKLAEVVKHELAQAGPRATLWAHPLMVLRSREISGLRPQLQKLGLKKPADWKYWHRRSLVSDIKGDLYKAVVRGLFLRPADVAIIPTGMPSGWCRGKTMVLLAHDGFIVRRGEPRERLKRAWGVLKRGLRASYALRNRPQTYHSLPPAPARRTPIPARAMIVEAKGVSHEALGSRGELQGAR
jgi:GT2 family glycosyltransferase